MYQSVQRVTKTIVEPHVSTASAIDSPFAHLTLEEWNPPQCDAKDGHEQKSVVACDVQKILAADKPKVDLLRGTLTPCALTPCALTPCDTWQVELLVGDTSCITAPSEEAVADLFGVPVPQSVHHAPPPPSPPPPPHPRAAPPPPTPSDPPPPPPVDSSCCTQTEWVYDNCPPPEPPTDRPYVTATAMRDFRDPNSETWGQLTFTLKPEHTALRQVTLAAALTPCALTPCALPP